MKLESFITAQRRPNYSNLLVLYRKPEQDNGRRRLYPPPLDPESESAGSINLINLITQSASTRDEHAELGCCLVM
jgi:hypothetical protein